MLLAVKARYALVAIRIANGALAGKLPLACFFRGFAISYPGALVLGNYRGFRPEFQRPGNGALVDLAAAFAPRPGSECP